MHHNSAQADSAAALAFVAARVLIKIPGPNDNGGIIAAAPDEEDELEDRAEVTPKTTGSTSVEADAVLTAEALAKVVSKCLQIGL